MLDEFTLKKLTTLTDKFVEEAHYDDKNRLNVTLKPEKNFKKSELYEGFLNLTLIAIRFKDHFQEMESANEVRKEEEMHHTPLGRMKFRKLSKMLLKELKRNLHTT